MADILRIATNVGTPLALLGLIVAVGLYVYSRRLKHVEKKLELLPPEERAKAADEYLTRYNIDGSNLTREQKVKLIQDEMEKRYRLARLYALAAAGVFFFSFALAVLAYAFRPVTFPSPPPDQPIRDIRVSVSTELPAAKDFDGYRKRLVTGIEPILKQPDNVVIGQAYVSARDVKDPTGKKVTVSIPAGALLFPSPKDEPDLATGVSNVWVWVWFFKDPAKAQARKPLGGNEGDLHFAVSRGAFDGEGLLGILLDYDVDKDTLRLSATGMEVRADGWHTNGKITTLSDLLDSTLVIQVASNPPQPLNAKPTDPASHLRDLPIDTFSLRVSNREFWLRAADFHRKRLENGLVYNVSKDKLAKFADHRNSDRDE